MVNHFANLKFGLRFCRFDGQISVMSGHISIHGDLFKKSPQFFNPIGKNLYPRYVDFHNCKQVGNGIKLKNSKSNSKRQEFFFE